MLNMAETSLPSSFAAIVVAAGKGLRVGSDTPKQYRQWRGKPLLRHSVEALQHAGATTILVVVADGAESPANSALEGLNFELVIGGATRQESVRNGLLALQAKAPECVLIHDAARPDLPQEVVTRLLGALSEHPGSVPVLPVVDSLAVATSANIMSGKADRDSLRRVQTPQAFRYRDILAAHQNWAEEANAGDDAQVLTASGGSVALVDGHERLKKITFAEDFGRETSVMTFRVGQGFDVHRLVAGEELWLCGIKLDHPKGLAGHSDADVALHAITDAILGAIAQGDIGTHFPPSDPKWAGARSNQFLKHSVELAADAGYALGNIDLTIICEAPKIGPHRDAMTDSVAEITGLDQSAISIKATTTERLGFTGRGEGIAAQAIVGLVAN